MAVPKLGGPIQAIPHDARPHASTPHTTTVTATKPAPKPPAWLNTAALTDKQMQDQATAEANAAIAPQVQGIQGQQQNYDAQQKAYEAAMTGFYQALAPYMAGIQGHVSDAYNSAAQTMGDIGHGYAGVLGAGADKNTADMNAALARAGQTQAIAPGNSAPMTDAFAATNGGIAGTSFAAEGAAKATDAANKPAIWAAQGRDSMIEAINKAVAGDKDYADQIAKIYATVPALRQTILKQVQAAEIDKAKLQESVKKDAFDQNYKIATLTDKRGKTAFDQKATIARINQSAQRIANQAYQSDRSYGVALSRLGISQKNLQLKIMANQAKLDNGGYTDKEITKFNALLQSGLNEIQTGTDANGATIYFLSDPNPKNKSGWTKQGKVYVHPVTYSGFLAQSVAKGVPAAIAIERANKFFPASARPQGPGALDFLLGISRVGGAASEAAPTGRFSVASTANRPGVSINSRVEALVASIAGVYGQPLTIGTGTNHNQYVVGTHRQSDHWNGNAADIPASGANLTRLGQSALIAAGANPAWAKRQKGGLFNLDTPQGRVQIIFNSNEGGNHYNHLHVGLNG